MIESFVDLTYRGLALGRRVKLTQVRPSTGYLELALPMPVGTQLSIASDEGIVLEATVIGLHEQVGGSERTPGMLVRPELGDPASATASWWKARVGLPELERPEAVRSKPVTVRPRTHTVPDVVAQPVPQVAAEHPITDDGKQTTVMDAVDQALLEQLASTSGEMPVVVDDGKQTIVMESVDVSALGLEPTDEPDDETNGSAKKRKKKR